MISKESSAMEVVLTQPIEKLGNKGDVIRVKKGYARNYLLPRGMAVTATSGNLKLAETIKQQESTRLQNILKGAKTLAEKLEKVKLTIAVQTGEDDKVFGSVTALTIAEQLQKEGYSIDKKDVWLEKPIKTLGLFSVPIKLHPDVKAEVKLYVIKE